MRMSADACSHCSDDGFQEGFLSAALCTMGELLLALELPVDSLLFAPCLAVGLLDIRMRAPTSDVVTWVLGVGFWS